MSNKSKRQDPKADVVRWARIAAFSKDPLTRYAAENQLKVKYGVKLDGMVEIT